MTTGNNNILATGFGKMYMGKFLAAQESFSSNNTAKGVAQTLLGVNQIPFSLKCMADTTGLAKEGVQVAPKYITKATDLAKKGVEVAKTQGMTTEALKLLNAENTMGQIQLGATKISPKIFDAAKMRDLDQFHFFFDDTILGKAIKTPGLEKVATVAKSLDKTLLDVAGKPIIEKLGGELVKDTTTGAIKGITGNASAQVAGNVLGKIPLLGVAIASLLELPAIKNGFDNGDGWQQVGRSAINVTGGVTGSAIGATLLAPIIPPLGSIVGVALGGWIGNQVAGFVGEKLIGKRKEKQETNEQQSLAPIQQDLIAQQQLQLERALERSLAPIRG
jgi:hypothetical protein